MASLLNQPTDERHTARNLAFIALVLILAAAAGFAIFYKHENHAPLEVTTTRVLTLPLHVTYNNPTGGSGGAVQIGAPEQTDDVIYIVPILKVEDKSDVPLFIKDITGSVHLQSDGDIQGRFVSAAERDRLLQLVPTLKPVLDQSGVPPLNPEQKVEPHTTVQGSTIFLYSMPPAEWTNRKSATVTLDFYHQDSVTVPLPR